jgi:hypothetical protein
MIIWFKIFYEGFGTHNKLIDVSADDIGHIYRGSVIGIAGAFAEPLDLAGKA